MMFCVFSIQILVVLRWVYHKGTGLMNVKEDCTKKRLGCWFNPQQVRDDLGIWIDQKKMCFQIPKKIRCGLYVWVSLKPHFLYGMVSKMCCFHRIGWWFLWGRFLCPKKGLPFPPQNTERTFQAGPKFPSQCCPVGWGHPWYQLGIHGSSATTLLMILVCQKSPNPAKVKNNQEPVGPRLFTAHTTLLVISTCFKYIVLYLHS